MVITSHTQLSQLCAELRQFPAIFLDTEFIGEGYYFPRVGAIQVAAGEVAALIDPLAIDDFSPFFALLQDPGIEKVFHAAQQDLAIFYRLMSAPVAPVFDTQIAAALLGYDEQISFANLVERTTGTQLQKSHGFTDWLRRPLTDGQVEYALDDVRLLMPAYAVMVRELAERERLAWAREEFQQRLERPERYMPGDPQELYLRIRGIERIHGRSLAVLRQLVAWREMTAREQDMPIGRVARDEVLIEMARRPKHNVKELYEIRGMAAQQVERFGKQLIAIATADAGPVPPGIKRLPSLPNALEPTVDFLSLCLRSLTSERGMCAGVVATRSDLAALILFGAEADIPLMRGWRRAAIGEALLATLNGQATARVIPGSRQVHLAWHDEATSAAEPAIHGATFGTSG